MSIDDATPQDWDRVNNETPLEAQEPQGNLLGPRNYTGYKDTFDAGFPKLTPTEDPINKPSHYNSGDIECIDAIEASMSPEAFKGYLKGNVEKYVWRMSYKDAPVKDLRKARWYLNRLIETETKSPTKL